MNIHGRYSYEGIPERESNRLLVLIITIGVAALMVLPIIQYADSHQQQSPVIYRYGNEYVQFSGQNAYVGFGNSMYPVSWAIYQINPVSPVYTPFSSGNGSSPLTVQTFSHYRTTRIENAYQNSAVMIRWNHNIRIAEIFSFINGGIDASVAIKNIENSSGTFMSAFSMTVNHSRNAQIGGFNPQAIHSSRGMGNQNFLIGSKDWSISTGNLSISWKNEQSIFSAGVLSISPSGNRIALPFGPLTLSANETFTIDPLIRPMIFPRPPSGGSDGQPLNPSMSLSTDHAVPGQYIYVNASLVSAGYGGCTWQLQAMNYTSELWSTVVSDYVGSGLSHEFIWRLPFGPMGYDWSEMRVVVSNQYGSTGSLMHGITTLTRFPVAMSSTFDPTVFNSHGSEIGKIVLSSGGPSSPQVEGSEFSLALFSSFLPVSSNFAVNYISQGIQEINTSNGINPLWSPDPNTGADTFFFQRNSGSNSSLLQSESYLSQAFSLALSIAIPLADEWAGDALGALIGTLSVYHLVLNNHFSQTINQGQNYFQVEFNSGTYKFATNYTTVYYTLGDWYSSDGFTPSFLFPTYLYNTEFQNANVGNINNPALVTFRFSTNVEITDCSYFDNNGVTPKNAQGFGIYGGISEMYFTLGYGILA